jgi:hypothetical protein
MPFIDPLLPVSSPEIAARWVAVVEEDATCQFPVTGMVFGERVGMSDRRPEHPLSDTATRIVAVARKNRDADGIDDSGDDVNRALGRSQKHHRLYRANL